MGAGLALAPWVRIKPPVDIGARMILTPKNAEGVGTMENSVSLASCNIQLSKERERLTNGYTLSPWLPKRRRACRL